MTRVTCFIDGCGRPVLGQGLCNRCYKVARKAGLTPLRPSAPRDHLARWNKRVDKTDTCWLWMGRQNARGYGCFDIGLTSVLAHRFGYETLVGPIPDGFPLDHLCRVHHCVNPDHLEPVTPRENSLRGFWGQREACSRGHEFTPENTRSEKSLYGHGFRRCKTCQRENTQRYLAKKAGR